LDTTRRIQGALGGIWWWEVLELNDNAVADLRLGSLSGGSQEKG
jgi:hypothetical protein